MGFSSGSALSLQGVAAARFPVSAYGALSDGVTDDTAAAQNACNAAALAGGGLVTLPLGRSTVISGASASVSIPSGVVVGSEIAGPFDPNSINLAPVVLVTSRNFPPFAFASRNAGIQDLLFSWPNQVSPTSPTPTAYPAAVTTPVGSAGCNMRRLTFANAYVGFQLYGGRHRVDDCLIGALSQPFIVDHSLDVIRLAKIQCSPLWNTVAGLPYPQTLDTWVGANQTVLTAMRADDLQLNDLFAFHGNIGINLIDGTDAPAQSYGEGVNVRFDTFSVGVRAQSTQSPGWKFSNLGVNASSAPVSLPAGGAGPPKVIVRGGSFWGAAVTPANAANGVLDIDGVLGYNGSGVAPAILYGSGVPSNSIGTNGSFFMRVDTPATASQRIYNKQAGVWVGIV